MDELTQAFEGPTARAAATATTPCDRISVRDHIREVEIGAFRAERGQTQRIRFNIVVEVSAHVAAQDDDVDKVLSYDTITSAVETELASARINLLETLAERVAARILKDRRAIRIFVRIEKLDRIPGALGVEIVRSRRPEVAAVVPVTPPPSEEDVPGPELLFLGQEVLKGPHLEEWLSALTERQVVLLLPPLAGFDLTAVPAPVAGQILLLSMDQNAVRLAALHDGLAVADSLTEMRWALDEGLTVVLAPSRLVAAAPVVPDWSPEKPETIAPWLAERLDSPQLSAVGTSLPDPARIFAPAEWKQYGTLDL
ncbi:dihydroneopterin aldolase [Algicella marina]|nr:dihydroneopterin aldolase [Algicella marina]